MTRPLRKYLPPEADRNLITEEAPPYYLDEEAMRELRAAEAELVTEDNEPVDNIFSAKQQRLLVEPLYSSWKPQPDETHPNEPRKFIADANVGLYYSFVHSPIVPDMLLSLDVEVHEDWFAKENRSYMVWRFGKVPEIVVEVVSNRKGGELSSKLKDYAQMGILYYVVHDPSQELSKDLLRVYELGFGKRYRLRKDYVLPAVGLSLKILASVYEDYPASWLRWCDQHGNVIPTGAERAAHEAERAAHEAERAAREAARADRAEAELERLRKELAQARRKMTDKKVKGRRP